VIDLLSDESVIRTIRDLAALAALSANWVRDQPDQVAKGFVDLLLSTLDLDFAYLRLRLSEGDGNDVELGRAVHLPISEAQSCDIGKVIAPLLQRASTNEVQTVTNPVGGGKIRVLAVPIGRDGEEGVLVAGSKEAVFPGEAQRLILNVVAVQAATALQCRRAEEARKRLLRERDEVEASLKRNEEKLGRSESLMAETQHLAHIGSWNWDIASETVIWSDEHYRIFGMKPQEMGMTYERVLSRVHPDDRVIVQNRVEQAFRDHQPYECVLRALHRDGTVRVVLSRAQVVFDEDDNPVRMFGTAQDITDSKSLQDERDRSVARLRLQIDRLPLAYILLDPNHHVLEWNPAAEQMFGYSKADALGQLCLDLIHQKPMDHKVRDAVRRVESGDMDANNINENYTKDGRTITCQWFNTPLMDPDGKFAGVISLAQDITERKQAEEEFHVLNVALEQAVEGIARLDTQGHYLTVNPAYAGMLGYGPEELVGMNWRSTVHPEHLENVKTAYQRMLGEARAELECLGVRKDGSVFWKQIVMVKAHDQHGLWTGHHGFIKDINERKRAEKHLGDLAARLQVLSRRVVEVQEAERRHLARELHDEIGQVLSAISLNLHTVKSVCDAAAFPRIEESIRIVDQATAQVRTLSLDLRPAMLDDLGLTATLRWLVDREAQRAGLVAHINVRSSRAPLPPDVAVAAFRVVQESLTNAVRHARARNVWVKLRQRDDELDLAIRDDGVGFDPDSARNRAARGESFGLLGIQERAALLGGRADIRSRPGHGTSIRVWFPIESPPSAEVSSDESLR
jgi:PAS domain S-box-containing protein